MPFIRQLARIFAADAFNGISYMKINKTLLTVFGLWPHSSSIIKRCNYTAFAIWAIICTAILLEGLLEMTIWDIVMFYGTIAVIMWIMSSLLLATAFYADEQSLKKLYEQMECNLKAINDAEEIAIMETFSRRATSMIATYIKCGFVAAIAFIVANFLPAAYKNSHEYSKVFSTYSKRWIFLGNLYELQIIVHSILIICYIALLYITILYVYLCNIEHTCGLFAIVSYRLQKLAKPSATKSADKANMDDKVISELVDIIMKHEVAIRSCDTVGKTFNTVLYILQVIGLIFGSVLIFGIQLSFNFKSIHLIFRAFPMAAVIIHYGFYLNYGGQKIIDISNKVFIDAWYFTGWESMPMKARKIVLMIILRSSRTCVLKAGLMTLSSANFTNLVKTCWSLATVIFSTQKNGHT